MIKQLFTVNVVETHYGFVEVTAESQEAAESLAYEELMNGNGVWSTVELQIGAEIDE